MRWWHKFRSSKSGRYVTPDYAEHHPATTTEEREAKPVAGPWGQARADEPVDPVWPPPSEPGDRLPPVQGS